MQISQTEYKQLESSMTDKRVSVVMDGYDFEQAMVDITTGPLKERIITSRGTFVVRPDSGNPVDVVMQALEIIGKNVGYTINSKGYKVLHPSYRVIQGDGVDIKEIRRILSYLESKGWSAENIAFGIGGGLLQQLDRDTQRFAMKMCAAVINGEMREVFKQPKTDPSKASKKGYLTLLAAKPDHPNPAARGYTYGSTNMFGVVSDADVMETVFENGKALVEFSLDEARALSDAQANYPDQESEWLIK